MRAGALRAYGRGANHTADKIVPKKIEPADRAISFSQIAKFAFPTKTEYALADLLGCDPKTARRWLSDESEPPAAAAMFVINEITRRYLAR